jgi:hypothetical protein
MDRWEALSGVASVAILFVPIFVAIFSSSFSPDAIRKRRAARDRRIALYRMSPESRLLILND